MYRRRGRVAAFFLFCMISVFLPGLPVKATSIQRQKQEKNELLRKKQEEEKKREGLKKKRKLIEKEIEKLDRDAGKIAEKLEEIGKKIDKNQKEIQKLELEIKVSEELVQKQYDTMKRRIKYMYENGDASYLDLILGSRSIEDLLNKTEYMAEISEYDNNLIKNYIEAKNFSLAKKEERERKVAELEGNKEEANEQLAQNKILSKEKEGKFKEYNSLISEADVVITKFSGEIAEKEAYIDQLIAAEERRRKEEERRKREEARKRALAERNKNNSAISSGNGSTNFSWPLPSHRYISSGFGYRGEIIKGSGTFHSGVDIPAPFGTGIQAAESGTVAAAGYHYSMGNYVLLSHGDGIYTVYMHGSKLLVHLGDNVSKGQRIALVGSTGFSTGPHLHFGVKVNGSYKNPLNYVSP